MFRWHPVFAFFLFCYAVSWTGASLVALPSVLHGVGVSKIIGILMFPAMLLGPSLAGFVMTGFVDGVAGIRDLFRRMRAVTVAGRWYAVLLIPSLVVLVTLALLSRIISPAFTPNHFYLGILFGIPAGFFEEIGWTGFAFPRLQLRYGFPKSAVVLGVLWAVWHLPVINYVGAATPHGAYWFRFFVAFAFAMTAMRVLISWLYANTKSVLLAQLMHVSSTGALVVFSPLVSAAQEAMWYAIYGCSLWAVVGVLAAAGQFARDR